jgi:hypothetical protein
VAHRKRSPRHEPAREVKTERFSRTEGKTPAFVQGEVQKLLDAVETSTQTGLRDRALLGTLAYTFARIGAVVNLRVEDYYPSGKRFLLVLIYGPAKSQTASPSPTAAGASPSADERAFLTALSHLHIDIEQSPSPLSAVREATAAAMRYGLTAYDAAYVDLARERLTLATLDASMRQAAEQSGVAIFQARNPSTIDELE